MALCAALIRRAQVLSRPFLNTLITIATGCFCGTDVYAGPHPVLVIGTATNPFTRYYSEILRTEGFNGFQYADIGSVSGTTLAGCRLALIGEVSLTQAQASMLSTWVSGGGKLIAMRPDKRLVPILGLSDAGSTMAGGYLLVNTAASPGNGIVSQTIQFHGAADLYISNGAATIATLYSTATAATASPAVSLNAVGANGGEAAAFTFDLARSIVYTRQGNPAWAGQERDGQTPIRSNDLFFGASAVDPQPDWIDRNRIRIPQADEQQRLLANLILYMLRDRAPTPRFWYLPFFRKAAVVLTGDDHASGGTAGRFDAHKLSSPQGCSVANWECIRSTSYVYPNSPLTNAQAVAYNNDGFEIALHATTGCSDWTRSSLESAFTSQLGGWRNRYSGIPAPVTNRTHCLVWSDYFTQPEVELANGIRLDTNYYYWPPEWLSTIPGYFTGSAMPMKFTRTDGSTIDVYQSTTQMTDESSQSYPEFVTTLLDAAVGPQGYYSVLTANIHTDTNGGASSTISDQIITAATQRGVPVVSARQMLTWLDARDASTFTDISWSGSILTFSVASAPAATGLRAMLPAAFGNAGLTGISRNGAPVSHSVEVIKGIPYAVFPATAGAYAASYGGTAVSISVSPATVTLADSQTQQFTAVVTGASDTSVVWSIEPPIGSISGSGLYTAPANPAGGQVNVIAYSVANPSRSGSAVVQLLATLTPPVISSVTTSGGSGTAIIEWTTDEASTSIVDYGTSPTELTQQVTLTQMVTAHSVTLTGLTAGGRYYYRVTSTDADGAVAKWPPASQPAASAFASPTLSVWNRSAVPSTIDSRDTASVELGMKFQSTVGGYATGLRFYKAVANTGAHVATLWSRTGTMLARISASAETTAGWQELVFDTPVQITPNTTYVVSYFAPAGRYSLTTNAFTSEVSNDTLRALRSGADGGNGVYRYGSSTGFPTSVYRASNYWVDVLFTTTIGPDTTAPVIFGVLASPGSATTATVTWTTNEKSDSTVLYGTDAGALSSTATGNANTTAHSVPLSSLAPGSTYYYRVVSMDAHGNSATWPAPPAVPASFTTAAPDATPPTISAVAVSAGSNTASITWTTSEAATSRVDYGVATSLGSNVSTAALVTTHTINLTGLTPGTTYYYRVSSTDPSGNAAQSPEPQAQPLTFTTQASISLWDTQTPSVASASDIGAIEVGVKFQSVVAGYVSGVRFYKGTANTGTHVGKLWTSTGALLASVTFANETASGWQQAPFATPVAISANTIYVVSYHAPVGRYAIDPNYFSTTGRTNGPLTAPSSASAGGNGVYRYGSGGFPTSTYSGSNYWVDVLFTTAPTTPDTTPPVVSAVTASPRSTSATVSWTTGEPATGTVQYGTAPASLVSTSPELGTGTAHAIVLSGLTAGQTYYYRVVSADAAGNSTTYPASGDPPLSFATSTTISFWDGTDVPAIAADSDTGSVELGLKFRSTISGQVRGIRFYKGLQNTGTHVGNLWSSAGQLLATVTFQDETASGWQEATFPAPVSIGINTTYVISYHAPAGRYALNTSYFASQGAQSGPLLALQNGVDGGNGVYRYGATSGFPTQTYQSSNYWVDVIFAEQ